MPETVPESRQENPSQPPAADPAEVASAIIRLERVVATRLAGILGEECSVDCWLALKLLSDGEGHAMSELIAHTLLPPSTVTRLVDGLIAGALAYRHADERDRRRVLVYATHRGKELHSRLAARVHEQGGDLLASESTLAALSALVTALDS